MLLPIGTSAYVLIPIYITFHLPLVAAVRFSLHFIMFLRLLVVLWKIDSATGYLGRYCYSRNGTALFNPAFQPCSNATAYSACCMTNHSGAGDVGIADDVCMPNGLCQNFASFDGKNEAEQVWARQGCTDSLWNNPYCLGEVCNKPEVYHRMFQIRMLLTERHSTLTNGATSVCGIVEGKTGAVEKRSVVVIRTTSSYSPRLWVQHRLFSQQRPFLQPQRFRPRRLRQPPPHSLTSHQKA